MSKNISVTCPHWLKSSTENSCGLSEGGLFIPVTRHIETFCETGNFSTCSQFQRALILQQEAADDAYSNRRQYERVLARYQLMLAEMRYEEEVEGLIDDSAITVDLSPGGMRLESHQPVPVDSLVSFSLNGDFSGEVIKGSGLVKWCKSLDNAPMYQAGLAFTDTLASNAIRRQLVC